MARKEIVFTEAQDAALTALLEKTGETYADLVRRLIRDEAARAGIEFPLDQKPAKDLSIARQKRWNQDKEN